MKTPSRIPWLVIAFLVPICTLIGYLLAQWLG